MHQKMPSHIHQSVYQAVDFRHTVNDSQRLPGITICHTPLFCQNLIAILSILTTTPVIVHAAQLKDLTTAFHYIPLHAPTRWFGFPA
jgi:hypothetical protein